MGLIESVVPNRGTVPDDDLGRPHPTVVLFEESNSGDVLPPRIHDLCLKRGQIVHSTIIFEPVVVGFDDFDFVRFVIEDCFVHFVTFLLWTGLVGLSSKKEVSPRTFRSPGKTTPFLIWWTHHQVRSDLFRAEEVFDDGPVDRASPCHEGNTRTDRHDQQHRPVHDTEAEAEDRPDDDERQGDDPHRNVRCRLQNEEYRQCRDHHEDGLVVDTEHDSS